MTTKTQEAALKFILKDIPNHDKISLLHMKLTEEARSADGAKRAIIRATEKLTEIVQSQMTTLTKYSGYNGDYYVSQTKELVEEIADITPFTPILPPTSGVSSTSPGVSRRSKSLGTF